MSGVWDFWIDRGGTFTDVVARDPDGALHTAKLLSENPEQYKDAALAAIRRFLGLDADALIPLSRIGAVKMGTTVATNALLERKGDRTGLVITQGLADQLRLAYQHRPRLFDRHIVLPEMLYDAVVEAEERVRADGTVERPLDADKLKTDLNRLRADGIDALAIVFAHGYRHTGHEAEAARIARELGFSQVSVSHEVSPLMKMVSRGDTTVVDAYLSPILRRYVDRVADAFDGDPAGRLMFMQSSGGLTDARLFQGKDAILSGPAGGVVGAVRTSQIAGFDRIIGFDMGGTSTDVCHFAGEYERVLNTEVAGVRITAPMMNIHTVAAGGGSLLTFDGQRMRVGPESAGADPGPACYGRGGPLAVTDANVLTGKLRPEFFPAIFGPNADQPLDVDATRTAFGKLADEAGLPVEELADGFLRIAVENMANAIKKISVQRGYEVSKYCLTVFGGAGAQHACAIADTLGMETCLIHPFASLLSAYGMGLADIRASRQQAMEAELADASRLEAANIVESLMARTADEVMGQGVTEAAIRFDTVLNIKVKGTDTALPIPFSDLATLKDQFAEAHLQRFGFAPGDAALIIESVAVEAIGEAGDLAEATHPTEARAEMYEAALEAPIYSGGWHDARFVRRDVLRPGDTVTGPAVLVEEHTSIVIEPGWQARITAHDHVTLHRIEARADAHAVGTEADPVMLEVFNNLYMSIAEQMGAVLENTAASVTIKERLDFSCAIFDAAGDLIANAPHMPVHLGSMGASVKAIIAQNPDMGPGDAYVLNAPYNGGTHLPDITLVQPVFSDEGELLFFTSARGHHTDVGGLTPGSMPPDSRTIHDEGALIDNWKLVDNGYFRQSETEALLLGAQYPVRAVETNIADLKAQVASCAKGAAELHKMVALFGLDVVQAYMRHVQDNAEECVRRAIETLHDAEYIYKMDPDFDGQEREVRVRITVDRDSRSATVDFTGTTGQLATNYNAPEPVTRAAVLYVFRLLVDDDIPMNEGVMKPLEVILPKGTMLSPEYPAAVIAGNVETSQAVTSALLLALGVQAAAQSTMNNTTWGNADHQYYETICGGTGAGRLVNGAGHPGTGGVHSHMTNSRLTDPEVLEWRFPVVLDEFSLRQGSGGKGEFPGGDGTRRKTRFLEGMTLAILTGHRLVPPPGLEGGEAGALGVSRVVRADGRVETLKSADRTELKAGDVYWLDTPTGGGFTPS
ncbi:hydantoinase B/oxoprolinase family protein [Pontivivens insulae]|uniref:Acetophenone carboxylase gamma subunit n=1 Tax=Pontivivens insulae TaxID=1639689 RepID=A0A2R8AE07_9RHOB|nr:hydantoinase B/oxoprolinase family protein [Pontivivens insulae]RED14243.1 5-oxoprolinase (ATP-hydrolysing) [Pontivivens insulae]SPF30318.1 Acetophenone carboxylase gamma subunit [Pontivivens insulae]